MGRQAGNGRGATILWAAAWGRVASASTLKLTIRCGGGAPRGSVTVSAAAASTAAAAAVAISAAAACAAASRAAICGGTLGILVGGGAVHQPLNLCRPGAAGGSSAGVQAQVRLGEMHQCTQHSTVARLPSTMAGEYSVSTSLGTSGTFSLLSSGSSSRVAGPCRAALIEHETATKQPWQAGELRSRRGPFVRS